MIPFLSQGRWQTLVAIALSLHLYCCASVEAQVEVTFGAEAASSPLRLFEMSDNVPGLSKFIYDEAVDHVQLQRPILAPTTVSPIIGRSVSPSMTNAGVSQNRSIVAGGDRLPRLNLAKLSSLSLSVRGIESKLTQATDIGGLFRKSASAVGVQAVRRQTIVHNATVRDHRDTQTKDAGSYWVPARMDLDTALSKIDSRLLQDVVVIKGPYSAIYGPGFSFIDFKLMPSPRFSGFEHHAETSLDYQTNGEQWAGRQTVVGGDDDSGFRISYGHRTGNDYETGNGQGIPGSYKSRDVTFTYGADLTPNSRIEFSALRLDQTDVELPGQAFDIDYLTTDAYEVEYVNEMPRFADQFSLSTWYNRTELAGSAQRAGKQRQFPVYEAIDFVGRTDVDSLSTGYTAGWTWGDERHALTAGTDLRFLKQELNEVTSGDTGLIAWRDRNSPIPRSHQTNPGLFAQHSQQFTADIELTAGARVDFVDAEVDAHENQLDDVGVRQAFEDPLSLRELLGSDQLDQEFALASVFMVADVQLTSNWSTTLGYGYAERAPTLTELYAAEPFMFLLQNGLNSVLGNPDLDKERMWQLDLGLTYDNGRLRGGVNGFHAWVRDYITFENMNSFTLGGVAEQSNLRFVNTELATLAGGEFYTEYEASPWLTGFATMRYVEGRDRSRNGAFATEEATFSAVESTGINEVAGASRGAFSGQTGADQEALPNIGPLEARVGLRLHESSANPNWGFEVSARIVDNQDRVATSLRETETPGFTIWDVRSYLRPRPGLLMVAGIENLTDKLYREYLDFRSPNSGALTVFQPGVNFYFGTELSY